MEDTITTEIRKLIREELEKQKPRLFPPLEPVPPFRLYSVKSAAKLLGTSEYYIYDRVKDGSLSHVVDLGGTRGKYRIRADALEKFIESRTM